jgi:hypothetical protein
MSDVIDLIEQSLKLDADADRLTDEAYDEARAALDEAIANARPETLHDVGLLLNHAAGYLHGGVAPHMVQVLVNCRRAVHAIATGQARAA